MRTRAMWTEAIDGLPDEWQGYCGSVEVDHSPAYRVSELLGPDGEPLKVGYARPRVGFDLTPRAKP